MRYLRKLYMAFFLLLLLTLCSVSVLAAEDSPAFSVTSKTVYVNQDSYRTFINGLTDDAKVKYVSSKESVATVDSNGFVVPVSVGKTTVTATVKQLGKEYTTTIKITVKEPYLDTVTAAEGVLVGSAQVFKVKRYGCSQYRVNWSLSGSQYASVASLGPNACMVTGLSEGRATLTAECGGVTTSFDIGIYDGSGDLYIISPDSEPYYSYYTARSEYNTYTKHYFLLRSYLEKLEKTGGGVLVLKAGEYSVTNTLCVPSNTTIIFEDGVTVRKGDYTGVSWMAPTGSLFQTVGSSVPANYRVYSGYDGEHDIAFIGRGNAVIDINFAKSNAIASCHVTNLKITGLAFKNMNGLHFLEIDASQNVEIRYNSFAGYIPASTTNLRKEAINIDAPDKETGGFNQSWTSLDGTPDRDIFITDNLFYNLEAAIGSHKYSEGGAHTNINILRNQFIDVVGYSICAMNWQDCVIMYNTIERTRPAEEEDYGIALGILLYGAYNPTVTLNYFSNCSYPISCQNWEHRTGGGKSYAPIMNDFSEQNLADMKKNYAYNCTNYKIRDYYVLNDYTKVKYYKLKNSFIVY